MTTLNKEHLKQYGAIYAVIGLLGSGGGVAAWTDSFPVTQGEWRLWTETHSDGMHSTASEAIDKINQSLGAIQLEQTISALRRAYADKCRATGTALAYIEAEIERLQALYFKLTKREYRPPPCLD